MPQLGLPELIICLEIIIIILVIVIIYNK